MVPSGEDNHKKVQKPVTPAFQDLNTDPLWTAEDVATYLRLESETVRSMTREGKLPGFKVGRVWRYRHSDIKSWIHDQGS